MLKKRILTALVLIPLVILIILFAPPFIFAAVSGALFIFAYGEWPRMAGYQKFPNALEFLKAFIFAVVALCGLALCFLIILYPIFKELNFANFSLAASSTFSTSLVSPASPASPASSVPSTFLTASLLTFFKSDYFWASFLAGLWLLPLLAVLFYPRGSKWYTKGTVSLGIGMIILTLAWFSLVLLQATDPRFALYPLILVWIADTFAYFVGKRFGRLKLAPEISPQKTWEGVLGAVVGGLLLSIGLHMGLNLAIPMLPWVILTTVVVLISVVGDLFESTFKRAHHLKDSGNLLPGHGGLLDRIDAILSALPVFAAGFLVLFGILYYSEVPLPSKLFFQNF